MAVSTAPGAVVAEEVRPVPLTQADLNVADRIAGTSIVIATAALAVGITLGVMQGLEHVGINLYQYVQPWVASYYHGLTMHGVLNALVWTTFFIVGFFTFALVRSLDRPLRYPKLNVLSLIVMVFGLLLAAIPMLTNNATVLYTFYPPLQADWTFYMGLTLVVVGSWMAGYGYFFTLGAWRKEHPGENQPFIALTICITMAMWQLATLGVAAEILFLLLPWSLGLVPGTDPLLGRTLFWFFGHPLVYFWLLPAYVSWYAMMPKQTDGKMFSEPLARLVFWLFLLLSTPVGFHHQYTDPGIPQAWKYIHAMLTYGVAFPSLVTAFTVVASLEIGARVRGGTGYFGWVRRLNWGNPSYAAQNLAMILFAFGGISGITNASYNLNLAVHNTMWIPGHFHLTVGSAVTLTFMGIAYWLVPKLTGRNLFTPWLALAQAWTWFVGMLLMSNALHLLGLHTGAPRRSMLGSAPYASPDWNPYLMESAAGVLVLTVSGILFFVVMIGTLFNRKLTVPIEMPVAEPLDPTPAPKWLDNWTPWVVGAVALVVFAYGPMLYQLVRDMTLWSQPWRVW
jgi:cytochrome c oxidase subunit 1